MEFATCFARASNCNYKNGLDRPITLVPVPEEVKEKIAQLGEETMGMRWCGPEYYWMDQNQLDMLDALIPVKKDQMILGQHHIYAEDKWGRVYTDLCTTRRIKGGCIIQMRCMLGGSVIGR